MNYYIGTQSECENYNNTVATAENYQQTTTLWADVRKHPTQELYAIAKHDSYSATMEIVTELTKDWNKII
jgi:head-tail adaptor